LNITSPGTQEDSLLGAFGVLAECLGDFLVNLANALCEIISSYRVSRYWSTVIRWLPVGSKVWKAQKIVERLIVKLQQFADLRCQPPPMTSLGLS